MRYTAGAQTVSAGTAVPLTTSVINSTGAITASGTTGLTLAAGQYLLAFVADSAAVTGNTGAVLGVNGAPLSYTSCLVTGGEQRLALQAVLNLTATGTVTVLNNAGNPVTYGNAVLTVVKLA